MKITNIVQDVENGIFTVTETPNLIEKFFGFKEVKGRYRYTGYTYNNSGGGVYVNEMGKQVGNNFGFKSHIRVAIDEFKNRF